MHPTLLDLPLFGRDLAIDAHGLLLTAGAILGLILLGHLARKERLPAGDVRELGLELILVGIVTARILHRTTPALALYGGMAAALGWLAWRAPARAFGRLRVLDLAAPGAAIGYALARVGCFLAGCCAGRPTEGWTGVRFPADSVVYQTWFERGRLSLTAETTPPLHPLQLYDAAAHLLVAIALLAVLRRLRAGTGRVFVVFGAAHVFVRLLLLAFAD